MCSSDLPICGASLFASPRSGRPAAGLLIAAFFSANAVLSGAIVWGHDLRAKVLVVLTALAAAAFVRFPAARRFAPVVFGFAGVFFGFQPYAYFSTAFTFLCASAGLALVWRNLTQPVPASAPPGKADAGAEGLTFFLMSVFVLVCAASLLTLPGGRFLEALGVFGPLDFYRMTVFSTASQAPYPLAAVNRLALVALAAREFSLVRISDKYRELAYGLCCGLISVTLLGFLEFFHGGAFILHYRFQSVFANPGWYAEYAVICAPFFLLYLRPASPWSRLAGYAGFACAALAVALTLARAGWLALLPTLAVFVWLTVRDNPYMRFNRKKGLLLAIMILYLGLTALSFWVGGRQLSYFSRPINALFKERVSNFADSPRPRLFLTGLAIGSESPLYGLGFESYALRYPALASVKDSVLAKTVREGDEVFETAHNLYVQLFAGSGLLGLGLWLGLAISAGRTLYDGAIRSRSLMDLAMLLALIAFHIYGFFQNMFYVPAAMLLIFLVFARAMSLERGMASGPGSLTGGVARALALAALSVSILGYAADPGLSKLAARHGLSAMEPAAATASAPQLAGTFGPEIMDGRLGYWSCGASSLRPGGTGPATLLARTAYPDPAGAGARLEIWSGDGLLDVAEFHDNGWKRLAPILSSEEPQTLYLLARPIYYPNVFGAAGDHRPLGAAFILDGPRP